MKNPLRSLPARIVLSVIATTLITSLSLAAVSVNLIDSFLRESINNRFPDVLRMASNEIDQWYVQRLGEISVFSKSEVLQQNLEALAPAVAARRRERARAEIEQYAAYVLAGFPQYAALFILDARHEPLLRVGEEIELEEAMAAQKGPVSAERVGGFVRSAAGPIQVASAPIRDGVGGTLGSLHAVLRLDGLREMLPTQELGPSGRIMLVTSQGRLVVDSGPEPAGERFDGPLPRPDEKTGLLEYTGRSGDRFVGSAQPFTRFGWTLVVEQPYGEAFAPVVSAIGKVVIINLAIVFAAAFAAFRIAVSIVRPIKALSAAARLIRDGERSVQIPELGGSDEVRVLASAFSEMTSRLTSNATAIERSHGAVEEVNERLRLQNEELQSVNEVLEQLSITDGLTKLHNHRYFQEALLQECKRAGRTESALSLILMDIDYFKYWNDRLGHAAGDQILRQLAEVMNELIRDTDLLARYGGEEFALITPGTDLKGAARLAEKIRATVAGTGFFIEEPGERDSITISIGVAAYKGDSQALFNDTDQALYRAKEAGRNRVVVAEPG